MPRFSCVWCTACNMRFASIAKACTRLPKLLFFVLVFFSVTVPIHFGRIPLPMKALLTCPSILHVSQTAWSILQTDWFHKFIEFLLPRIFPSQVFLCFHLLCLRSASLLHTSKVSKITFVHCVSFHVIFLCSVSYLTVSCLLLTCLFSVLNVLSFPSSCSH